MKNRLPWPAMIPLLVIVLIVTLSIGNAHAYHLETFANAYDSSAYANSTTAGVPVEFALVRDAGDPSSAIKYWRLDFNGDGTWDFPALGAPAQYINGSGYWNYASPSQNWAYEGYGKNYRYAYGSSQSNKLYIVSAEFILENGKSYRASTQINVAPSIGSYTNHAPMADAGGTHTWDMGNGQMMRVYFIPSGAGLMLDASGSYDPDEQYGDSPLRYHWVIGPDQCDIYTTNSIYYLSPEQYPFLTEKPSGEINLWVIDRWGATTQAQTTLWDNTMYTPVPIPASLLLLGSALLGLAAIRRRP